MGNIELTPGQLTLEPYMKSRPFYLGLVQIVSEQIDYINKNEWRDAKDFAEVQFCAGKIEALKDLLTRLEQIKDKITEDEKERETNPDACPAEEQPE